MRPVKFQRNAMHGLEVPIAAPVADIDQPHVVTMHHPNQFGDLLENVRVERHP